MTSKHRSKLVLLAVLDGWGLNTPGPGNAISLAKTLNFNRFWASFPHTQLISSGESVGLPRGESGNTETGHLNLGAGKIVYQDLERINMSIADGSFFENKIFLEAFNHAKQNKSNLHLMSLIGAGGVHSNLEHLFSLIRMAKQNNISNIYIHIFTDGRDSPPTSSISYINKLNEFLKKEEVGQIASVMGRYWAMDRDRHWDRTAKAYLALTEGVGQKVKSAEEAINNSYSQGKTDEFVEPSIIVNNKNLPLSLISNNDSIVFLNFRVDRPRQLSAAFLVSDFYHNSLALDFDPYLEKYEKTHIALKVLDDRKPFTRNIFLKNIFFVTMTEYCQSLIKAGAKVAFLPEKIIMPLGKVISDAGMFQLRLAESEKERFVTYYFSGLSEQKFPGEDRIIVPSKNVFTYDLCPDMSAREITKILLTKMQTENNYSFILVNFANLDMVSHSGNIGPTVKACEIVDECIGKIANVILAYGGTLLITADHGNAEEMINPNTGQIDTEHNANPVPFIAVSKEYLGKAFTLDSGILADVAPTILNLMNLPIPTTMTGRNLLENIKY